MRRYQLSLVVLAVIMITGLGSAAESVRSGPRFILLLPDSRASLEGTQRSERFSEGIHTVHSWAALQESLAEDTCAVGYHVDAVAMTDRDQLRRWYDEGRVLFEYQSVHGLDTLDDIVGELWTSWGRRASGVVQYYAGALRGTSVITTSTSLFSTLERVCNDRTRQRSTDVSPTLPASHAPSPTAQVPSQTLSIPQGPGPTKWEYRVIGITGLEVMAALHEAAEAELSEPELTQVMYDALAEALNELGAEGWELVSSGPSVFVLRRPLS